MDNAEKNVLNGLSVLIILTSSVKTDFVLQIKLSAITFLMAVLSTCRLNVIILLNVYQISPNVQTKLLQMLR